MTADATALRAALAAGDESARGAVLAACGEIARTRQLGAFLVVDEERALERADKLDAERAAGAPSGPLFGLPFALKSNMCLAGVETNCGSRLLAGYRPPYTATFVERLLAAGAVPVGMTNMDEFAMGSSSEHSAFGPTLNPWDTSRAPGGSSSGSAVAVAAGNVPFALGSDTGGSVRQPAALCGVVGFKPTYGRVSRYGLIAFGSSLDQVSPFARSVRDIELVMGVLAGADVMDATSLAEPAPETEQVDLAGLRVGIPEEYFTAELDGAVRERTLEAIALLVQAGAERVPISLPHSRYALSTYYVLATAEASSNLARYDGVRYGARSEGEGSLASMLAATRQAGFGREVKRRILLGTYALSAGYQDEWYGRAQLVRRLIARDFERAFERCDLIIGPTTPTPAFALGSKTDDPVAMYDSDVLTVPASLAGLPALSLPCGRVRADGGAGPALPSGLQVIGPRLADGRVLGFGRQAEACLPPVAGPEIAGGAR